MKKLLFVALATLMVPSVLVAKPKVKKLVTYNDVYIYGQSNRNAQEKGSAVSLVDGKTMALEDAVKDTKSVDIFLYYGKVNHSKVKFFSLFSPEDPTTDIDWEKDGGTSPWCKFEGKSDAPDAWYALKNWESRNHTKLEKLDGVDYDAATGEQIDGMTVADSYLAEDVKVGDVILFQMDEKGWGKGRKGLIKITALDNDPDPKKADKKGQGQYMRMTLSVKYVK